MPQRRWPKLVILGDLNRPVVSEAVSEFARFVSARARILGTCRIEQCTPDLLKGCDFAVVFGGDGTIITAAGLLSRGRVPVIGVNLGKLGYLAEFGISELESSFDEIVSGHTCIERRMMLSFRLCPPRGDSKGRCPSKAQAQAVNDVYITAGPPFRVIELQIAVDGDPVASCVSDGLIVSTPTGSTAYNLSAGGPILRGCMKAMVVTPICPHSLSFRPIVINAASTVEIRGVRLNEGTMVSVDGHTAWPIQSGDQIRITKASTDFLVVNNPVRNDWQTLATKLGWAMEPRYARR